MNQSETLKRVISNQKAIAQLASENAYLLQKLGVEEVEDQDIARKIRMAKRRIPNFTKKTSAETLA